MNRVDGVDGMEGSFLGVITLLGAPAARPDPTRSDPPLRVRCASLSHTHKEFVVLHLPEALVGRHEGAQVLVEELHQP